MKHPYLRRFSAAVLCLLLLWALAVAAGALDTGRSCSLTLRYAQQDAAFPGLDIRIYRVAQFHADGTYERVEPYASWPVNLQGITSQKQWQDAASTLDAYITANGTAPYRTEITDGNGSVSFRDLESGIYLVSGAVAETPEGAWTFDRFLIFLPTPTETGHRYDVEALPKCSDFTETPEKVQYSLLKLWQDEGLEELRPEAVTVDILLDGAVQDTVVLSAANSWSHTWTAEAGIGQWTVVERDIPEEYWVTVTGDRTAFVITNSRMEWNPDDPGGGNDPTIPEIPPTGDIFPLWLWIVVLCLSGIALALLGIGLGRGQRREKRK